MIKDSNNSLNTKNNFLFISFFIAKFMKNKNNIKFNEELDIN